MSGYTKLFSSIITSSIWCEDDATLRVWIAILASCNPDGFVEGSVPGFANIARVTIEQMEAAIERFSSPDPHSRTPDNDGRRIEAIDGGWVVLNYARYRARRDPEERRRQVREAVQRHRDKKRNQPVIKNDYDGLPNPDVSHGKPKSEVRSQKSKKETTLSSRSLRSAARRLLAFLNDKAERHYQDVDAHMNMIMARLKDLAARNGHSLDDAEADCRSVIAFKVREWGSDEEMSKYLRPATLFNATKFASYHGELYKPPGGRRS